MGIFSTKKKHYVDTAIVPVLEDNLIPDLVNKAIVSNIFKETPIMDTVLSESLDGSFRSFERAYRSAARGDYFYGLPDAKVLSSEQGKDEAKLAIESEVGYPITLDYLQFRPLNNVHAGYKYANENFGHNLASNELEVLSAQRGYTVYLDKLLAVHNVGATEEIESSGVGSWDGSPMRGRTPERPVTDTTVQDMSLVTDVRIGESEIESVEIHYIWEDNTGTLQREFYTLDLSNYDDDQEYYQAKYTYSDGVDTFTRYWIYDPTDASYPNLDGLYVPNYTAPGTYFPFVVFRREKVNRADPAYHTSEEYLSTVKLVDKLGMDFQSMADSIHSNPDITDVEQAVMLLGVPMNTTDPIQLEYLYRHFDNLVDNLVIEALPEAPSISWVPPTSYAVEVADADFSMVMSFDDISRKLVAGTLPEEFTSTLVDATSEVIISNKFGTKLSARTARILRKQVTPAVYEEIRIENPKVRYDIAAGKSAVGSDDDDKLLIPIDYDIAKEMNLIKREDLYFRSLNFVFNSHIVQKVKWYQTGAFKTLLIIVAIIYTVYTGDFSGLVAALESGSVVEIVVAVLEVVVEYYVYSQVASYVFNELAHVLGPEVAAALAVVAVIYGAYKGIKSGNFLENSTAKNMLTLANGLVSGANNELANVLKDYDSELQEFSLLSESLTKELKELEDALDPNINLDPYTFIAQEPMVIFGESTADYYDRTAHSGNIGVKSLDFIQNFVEISLTLPTIADTAGAPNI
jgi:hypothetical protein